MKTARQMFTIIVFFIGTLLISYSLVALTLQRSYSIPDYKANYNNSTIGGDALGDEENFMNVNAFVGPSAGAVNVSLDTLIYVDQWRPFYVDLQIDPEIPLTQIERDVGHASRLVIFFPNELLRPNTTYNVSGTMTRSSVWWTFTTGSSIVLQEDYEVYLPFYAWIIALITSIIATTVFAKIIWKTPNKIMQSD